MNDTQRHAYGCAEMCLSLALDLLRDAEKYAGATDDAAMRGRIERHRIQLEEVHTTCDQRRKPAEEPK